MKTDYRILIAGFLMILCMIIYSVTVASASANWKLLGLTLSISILVFLLVFLPLKQYFATLISPNKEQIFLIIVGVILNFGWGGYYYYTTIKDQPVQNVGSVFYLIYFVFIMPWGILFVSGFFKWSDNNWKLSYISNKIELLDTGTLALFFSSFIFAMGSAAFLMWSRGFGAGGALFAFWIFVYYGLIFKYIYERNNKSIPRSLLYFTVGFVVVICLIALILSLAFDSFNDFLGFSITYLTITTAIMGTSYIKIQSDLLNTD